MADSMSDMEAGGRWLVIESYLIRDKSVRPFTTRYYVRRNKWTAASATEQRGDGCHETHNIIVQQGQRYHIEKEEEKVVTL
jgi:hypothetical protein